MYTSVRFLSIFTCITVSRSPTENASTFLITSTVNGQCTLSRIPVAVITSKLDELQYLLISCISLSFIEMKTPDGDSIRGMFERLINKPEIFLIFYRVCK